jgi:hypothetical protein
MAKTRSTAVRAQIRGLGWKRATTIDAGKYDLVSKAILASLTREPITYTEMVRRVRVKLKAFSGSVSWYTITVARELEVQQKIVRHANPVRYSR